jgi:hypothetical protein
LDGLGEETGDEFVVPGGQADLELLRGPGIELGRASRPRSRASAPTSGRHLEQAVVHHPVEVVGGQRAADADRIGGFVAADRPALKAATWRYTPAGRVRPGSPHPREIVVARSGRWEVRRHAPF